MKTTLLYMYRMVWAGAMLTWCMACSDGAKPDEAPIDAVCYYVDDNAARIATLQEDSVNTNYDFRVATLYLRLQNNTKVDKYLPIRAGMEDDTIYHSRLVVESGRWSVTPEVQVRGEASAVFHPRQTKTIKVKIGRRELDALHLSRGIGKEKLLRCIKLRYVADDFDRRFSKLPIAEVVFVE